MRVDKDRADETYKHNYTFTPSGMGATRANLLRILRSIDLVSWSTHEESGRVDRRAFTRYACGDANIFSKRTVSEAERSAVSIMIDCSGSMSYHGESYLAGQVAVQLCKILDKANAEFSVTGFYGNDDTEITDQSGASRGIAIRTEKPVFIPFKKWGESLGKASSKLGGIGQCAQGSTPDYSSIAVGIEDLAVRKEPRKILFLLTDANGYNQAHMKYLQKLADKQRITLIAIGIGHTEVAECFTHAENVTKITDLTSASLNKVLKVLK
jgi:cobalamin biosynthesis protein CobT